MDSPFGFITLGISGEVTLWTVTRPTASVLLATAAASASDIFSIMEDFLRPVPASGGPAFWAKKTSSVPFDLLRHIPLTRVFVIAWVQGHIPHDCFVEQRVHCRISNTGQSRSASDDLQELLIVNMKWLTCKALLGHARRNKYLLPQE